MSSITKSDFYILTREEIFSIKKDIDAHFKYQKLQKLQLAEQHILAQLEFLKIQIARQEELVSQLDAVSVGPLAHQPSSLLRHPLPYFPTAFQAPPLPSIPPRAPSTRTVLGFSPIFSSIEENPSTSTNTTLSHGSSNSWGVIPVDLQSPSEEMDNDADFLKEQQASAQPDTHSSDSLLKYPTAEELKIAAEAIANSADFFNTPYEQRNVPSKMGK
ncbi:MAG: hypothetical protein KGZ39_03770 [Simkania sp.]|nr:hypothetical protein [Simkania sp.]